MTGTRERRRGASLRLVPAQSASSRLAASLPPSPSVMSRPASSQRALSRRALSRVDGFTLAELLIALVIAVIVAGGVARLAGDARDLALAQPEAVDVTQRARVGLDLFVAELTAAGVGPSVGVGAGPLARWVPPIWPYRRDGAHRDPAGSAFDDRVTLVAAQGGSPFVAVHGAMESAGAPIELAWQPACPAGDLTCGLADDQRVAIVDRTASLDLVAVRAIGPLQVQPVVALTKAYRAADEARLVPVTVTAYYFDARRRQLRRDTGPHADVPVLDEVVGLSFRYFGARAPPADPRPPADGANCLFDSSGASTGTTFAADEGDLVELTAARLTDGPWCGSGGAGDGRFDADLYRIRRVRVTLRVQAMAPWVRGRDPLRFLHPGTAIKSRLLVPDVVLTMDVTPRNVEGR